MAITPWSWTASNGTATVAQTKAAYNAVTSKGNTYNFSRRVWNDLVSKINETAVALGHGWSNEILSLSTTKMSAMYSPLSAKRFNSARLNTNYRVWSWCTDESKTGYVGRDDFLGVDDVGDKDADFVYGRYFLELTDRLNLVIDIVNGGGETVKLKETIGSLVEIASEMATFATEHFSAKFSFSFSHTASLETEKQSTWVLHFKVDTPKSKAVLEIGNYNFCEASVYISPTIVRKPRTSPSSPLMVRFYFPQKFKTDFTLDESRPLLVDYADTPSFKTDITQEKPQPLTAMGQQIIDSNGNVIQIKPQPFYATAPQTLVGSAVLIQERMGIFTVRGTIYHYMNATAKADRSAGFASTVSMKHSIPKHTAHTAHSGSVANQTDVTLDVASDAHTGYAKTAEWNGGINLNIKRTAHAFPSESAEFNHTEKLNITRSMNARQSIPTNIDTPIEYALTATLASEHMGFFVAMLFGKTVQ